MSSRNEPRALPSTLLPDKGPLKGTLTIIDPLQDPVNDPDRGLTVRIGC